APGSINHAVAEIMSRIASLLELSRFRFAFAFGPSLWIRRGMKQGNKENGSIRYSEENHIGKARYHGSSQGAIDIAKRFRSLAYRHERPPHIATKAIAQTTRDVIVVLCTIGYIASKIGVKTTSVWHLPAATSRLPLSL